MRGLAITLAAAASAAAALTALSAHAGPATGVCAGENHCRVVAHDDVDGDGHNDAIALQRDGKRHIVVLVLTDGDALLSHRITLGPGRVSDRWGGSAAVDNEEGDELVVLSRRASATRDYTVVRYHNGALHTEASPDGEKRWSVAGTGASLLGWHQYFGDLGGYHMIRTVGTQKADGTYSTSRTVYAWRQGAWVLLGAGSAIHDADRAAAQRRAGFHITGLDRFPPK